MSVTATPLYIFPTFTLSSSLLQSQRRNCWRPDQECWHLGPHHERFRRKTQHESAFGIIEHGCPYLLLTGRYICYVFVFKTCSYLSIPILNNRKTPAASTLLLKNWKRRNRFQALKQILFLTQNSWGQTSAYLLKTFFRVTQPKNTSITGSFRHNSTLHRRLFGSICKCYAILPLSFLSVLGMWLYFSCIILRPLYNNLGHRIHHTVAFFVPFKLKSTFLQRSEHDY